MHSIANADQFAAWNGPEGEHWAREQGTASQDIHDALFAAAAIRPGDRVLDIGCGTGRATRVAARAAQRGEALGIDLSAPMLEQARALAAREGIANVRFVQGDAQTRRFTPAAFDVVISEFGIMFFADPEAAFANIGLALRSGGRLVFVCPREPERQEWYRVPLARLPERAAADQDASGGCGSAPEGPGMFSLAERERIVDVLTGAGFVDVAPEPIAVDMDFGVDTAEAARFFLGTGPVQALIAGQHGLSESHVVSLLVEDLQPYQTPLGVRLRGDLWLVTASRP